MVSDDPAYWVDIVVNRTPTKPVDPYFLKVSLCLNNRITNVTRRTPLLEYDPSGVLTLDLTKVVEVVWLNP